MAWLAVDRNGKEFVFSASPIRWPGICWDIEDEYEDMYVELPKGSIEKLIGSVITWEDEAVEYATT